MWYNLFLVVVKSDEKQFLYFQAALGPLDHPWPKCDLSDPDFVHSQRTHNARIIVRIFADVRNPKLVWKKWYFHFISFYINYSEDFRYVNWNSISIFAHQCALHTWNCVSIPWIMREHALSNPHCPFGSFTLCTCQRSSYLLVLVWSHHTRGLLFVNSLIIHTVLCLHPWPNHWTSLALKFIVP